MDQDGINQYVMDAFAGVEVVRPTDDPGAGDTFFFHDHERNLNPRRRLPFGTIITKDRAGIDKVSWLTRLDVFRLNIGVSREIIQSGRIHMTEPKYRTGKICYVEIPSTDISQSAEFYRGVFGWHIRQRGDGSTAFDDSVNEVSGTWVLGRRPAAEGSLTVHIMVADAAKARDAVIAAGGEIVQPVDPNSREVYFLFRDPAGNVMGVYQQPGLEELEK